MSKRVRIGDIIEIPTSRGLAYAQYGHKKEQWGALLRILPGFCAQRPEDFSQIANQEESFVVFFPLQAAISRGIFEVVAHQEIPQHARTFPLFRGAGFRDRQGRVQNWWLWDGVREWPIGRQTDEQRKLPLCQVWNDTLLIERIEEGWTPEKDRS